MQSGSQCQGGEASRCSGARGYLFKVKYTTVLLSQANVGNLQLLHMQLSEAHSLPGYQFSHSQDGAPATPRTTSRATV